MANRFIGKVTVSPSGIVKVSHGAGNRKSARDALGLSSPCLSFQTSIRSETSEEVYSLSDDCPPTPKVKAGWGLLGTKQFMSAKSCRNLRERMVATELEYGKSGCFFVTLTIPSDDPRAFEGLARFSSYAVNRISVWLSDFMESEFSRVGVWEYQKRGALHYHFLLGSDCIHAMSTMYFFHHFSKLWMNILESIEGEFECNMFRKNGKTRDKTRLMLYGDLGQRFCNVQRVEKSVSAYLSSYLSESNHDSKSKKNGLRKSFFPISTWTQWNRKATELFNKYSLEYSQAIWAKNYDDWTDLKNILLACIEKAENTAQLERSNPWWVSTIVVAKEKGLGLISLVRECIDDLKIMEISPKLFDGIKFGSRKALERKIRHNDYIREAKFLIFEKNYSVRSKFSLIGQRLADNLEQMMILMLECEKELIEHKNFDSDLKNYHQVSLNYGF